MSEGPEGKAARTVEPFHSVVVATDFSTTAGHAAERALRLPFATAARITLVHVLPEWPLPALPTSARADAEAELARRGEAMRAAAPPGVEVRTALREGRPYAEIARTGRAERAELVVLGRVGRHELRDLFLGSTAEQVVRNGECSTLLVRTPCREPYARPMCAVDLGEAADDVLRFAARVIEPSTPARVLHVYDAPFEGIFVPSMGAEQLVSYRRSFRKNAQDALRAVLAQVDAPHLFSLDLRHGEPRLKVPAAARRFRADLLVLGTHARRGLAYALLGSVAGDILRAVACDTLVVRPPVTLQRP